MEVKYCRYQALIGRMATKIGGVLTENGDPENLIKAEFLPSLLNSEGLNEINTVQCIYSLGIVFYEIFSGGGRPVELLKEDRTTAVEFVGFDPLPFDEDTPIDFGNKFDIFDDLFNDDNLFCEDEGQHLPKKRQTHQNNSHHTRSSISVEQLKAKWIPGPLCDLIANMLDSTNGTLAGEDSYKSMMGVRDDLQLMLEKPAIFLYDQDMGRLSLSGLQFRDTVFGRDSELSTIKEAYRRSISGDGELVIISGASGSGKTMLATEFGKYVAAGGGIVLSGKFDQLKQGKPFSALASAFDLYCGNLMRDSGPLRTAEVALKLISSLGKEVYHLARIIPNLAIMLGPSMSELISHDQEVCANPQKRLQYLLCQFVDVISSAFDAPVTLFLDDLQWAVIASIDAVNQLLFTPDLSSSLSKRSNRFFFFGCCCEGGINEQHPLWSVFCHANLLHVKYSNLQLRCFEEDTLNVMVSETLRLSPRLTWAFSSIVYRKTKGNPLFVSRLMLSLSKNGLLRPNLKRRRWEWDEKKIQSQKLPDDVAMFITNSIEAQTEDVKSSISVLSCFGASVDNAFIKTLEKALDRNLCDSLDKAVADGLLDKVDDKYHFSHDRIQEAAYSMMDQLNRCNFHFKYGMALAPLADGKGDDGILLTAANQLNLAGPEAVQDKSQFVIVANLNLRAGKKAMEMSDFVAAYSYFDNGMTFLRKKHWEEHYALSLELFDLAARCAHTNGDVISLNLLSQQVLTKSQSFEDRLNVMYYAMCVLASSSKLPESIERGLKILSRLGIDLHGCESGSVEACVQETKDLLSCYSDDEILNTERMTDPTKIMAMKFLDGMSPVSPIGFVHFGSYIAKLGDISGGYKYVKLARSLLDKVSRENAGEVSCFGTQVIAYVEPLQAVLEYHDEGYAAAMASGDVVRAGLITQMKCSQSLFAGINLQALREKYAAAIKFMEERKLRILTLQTQYQQQSVLKLIGIDQEPKCVSEGHAIFATNKSVMRIYYYLKMYTSFIFRSYDRTKENAEKYLTCIGNSWANLFLAHAFQAFHAGLISFWLARKSREEQG
eukprot:scaffold5908_cov152-Skeletonema_marinoi.AAC.1